MRIRDHVALFLIKLAVILLGQYCNVEDLKLDLMESD